MDPEVLRLTVGERPEPVLVPVVRLEGRKRMHVYQPSPVRADPRGIKRSKGHSEQSDRLQSLQDLALDGRMRSGQGASIGVSLDVPIIPDFDVVVADADVHLLTRGAQPVDV